MEWTQEEEKILVKNFYNYSDRELHELFFPERSAKSIERKIARLNLGSRSPEVRKRGIEKMANTKKEYYKTHEGWNKGKTFSEESRRKMSIAKRSINKWKGDDNPRHQKPLFGKDNGNWQGGITDLYRALRNELGVWYSDSIKFCNYKCVICGEHFEEVHHFYPYKNIMREAFENTNIDIRTSQQDYTESEWEKIKKEFVDIHIKYGYGICLSKKIHMLFHDKYSYHNCTPRDFLDFVYRLDCGEFDDWLIQNNISININYKYIEYLENILFALNDA